jgi:uncharacterized protein YbbC (DUF1343 family)
VHGLTTGEMAQLIRSRLGKPLRLTVVPMKGWKRGMTWADTGRPWPSIAPNLRSPDAALVYPGLGLLEATNVSEGRGTDQPFLLFGAPWLEPGKLPTVSGSGFAIEPARFTPRASAFAVNPKHKDAECVGARVSVRDAQGAHPYELGIQLLRFFTDQRGFAWTGPNALDDLVGTSRLRKALGAGESAAQILAADAPAIEKFRKDRAKFLLY